MVYFFTVVKVNQVIKTHFMKCILLRNWIYNNCSKCLPCTSMQVWCVRTSEIRTRSKTRELSAMSLQRPLSFHQDPSLTPLRSVKSNSVVKFISWNEFNYLIFLCSRKTIHHTQIKDFATSKAITFSTLTYFWKSRWFGYQYILLKFVPWVFEHPVWTYICNYLVVESSIHSSQEEPTVC